jgi:hypothetical protein
MIQLLVSTKALWQFAKDCLDPEVFGHKASAEMRDAAREALGLPKIEARQPSVPKPETDKHNSDVYSAVQQSEFNERDR